MARGNMTATRGTTALSLNDRFTMMGNVRPSRSPRRNNRSRGRASSRSRQSYRTQQLISQMENRPAVQAALRLRRVPMKPNIKQRLSLRGAARRGFRRSNSVGSLYTEPLKSEPKFRRGSLKRSNSVNSLNSFTSDRSRSRSRSTSRNRARSRSRTPQRKGNSGGLGGMRGGGRRGRGAPGRSSSRVFRRNSVSSFDSAVIYRDAKGFKQNRGGRQFGNRSRSTARGNVQRRQPTRGFNVNRRPGRGAFRNRRSSVSSVNNNQPNRSASNIRRGTTAGRARGGSRRGGANALHKIIKKEDLDKELDSYMAGSKSQLDRDLDSYMTDAPMEYQ